MTYALVKKSTLLSLENKTESQWAQNEQGGLLLGYRKKSGLQITGFTLPQSSDLASPMIFKRNSEGHAQLALKAWEESRGIVDWIGEWHTHPAGNSAPSTTDITNWVRLSEHARKPMGFLILSKFGWYVGLQHHSPKRLVSRATKGDIRHLAKSSTWHFGLPDKLSSIVTKADKNLRNCQKI